MRFRLKKKVLYTLIIMLILAISMSIISIINTKPTTSSDFNIIKENKPTIILEKQNENISVSELNNFTNISEKKIEDENNLITEITKYKELKNDDNSNAKIIIRSGGRSVQKEVPIKSLNEIEDEIFPNYEYMILGNFSSNDIYYEENNLLNLTGKEVKIAILDTGVNTYSTKKEISFINESSPKDFHGHGTMVTSLVKKYANESEILNVKVLNDNGVGSSFSVGSGIAWATEKNVDIIVMSLGSPFVTKDLFIEEALEVARSKGIIVLVAAGNCRQGCSGNYGVTYPGLIKEVITIGSVNDDNQISYFSSSSDFNNYSKPDFVALGKNRIVNNNEGNTVMFTGTSASTPYVASVIARLLENNSLNSFEVIEYLKNNAIKHEPIIDYGHGVISENILRKTISNYTIVISDKEKEDSNKNQTNNTGYFFQSSCSNPFLLVNNNLQTGYIGINEVNWFKISVKEKGIIDIFANPNIDNKGNLLMQVYDSCDGSILFQDYNTNIGNTKIFQDVVEGDYFIKLTSILNNGTYNIIYRFNNKSIQPCTSDLCLSQHLSLLDTKINKFNVIQGERITLAYKINNSYGLAIDDIGLGVSLIDSNGIKFESEVNKTNSIKTGTNWYYNIFDIPKKAIGDSNLELSLWSTDKKFKNKLVAKSQDIHVINIPENQISELLYDARGNLIQDLHFSYEYNDLNQLISVINKDNKIIEEYFYDFDGSRIKKINHPKNTTIYYISSDFIMLSNSSGNFYEEYYYIQDRLVGKVENDEKLFFHTNHLRSPDIITDISGNVIQKMFYSPFGQDLVGSSERFGFTGKELDDTELMYYGARYYSPQLMRFTQPDIMLPDIYDPQQINRYAYARNNPIIYVDDTGHWIHIPIGAAIGAIIGAGASIITDIYRGDSINWRNAAISAAAGAVAGTVGAATFGLGTSLISSAGITGKTAIAAKGTTAAVTGVTAGQSSRATRNVASGRRVTDGLFNPRDMATDAAIGVATWGVYSAASHGVSAVKGGSAAVTGSKASVSGSASNVGAKVSNAGSNWAKSTFDTPQANLNHHYNKYGGLSTKSNFDSSAKTMWKLYNSGDSTISAKSVGVGPGRVTPGIRLQHGRGEVGHYDLQGKIYSYHHWSNSKSEVHNAFEFLFGGR